MEVKKGMAANVRMSEEEKVEALTVSSNTCDSKPLLLDNPDCEGNTSADASQIRSEVDTTTAGIDHTDGDQSVSRSSLSWDPFSSSKEHVSHTSSNLLNSGVLDLKITPFYLRWSFGLNSRVPALNLTTKTETKIFFTSSLAAVLYDYNMKQPRMLNGHSNTVTSLATNDDGKWVVTADAGVDSTIIVWDAKNCRPIFTLFDVYEEVGTAVVDISDNGKYLIAVSLNENPIISFWLWTYGNETPNDQIIGKASYGKPVNVTFNPNVQEHIMVAFEYQVIFLYWDEANGKLQSTEEPQIRHKKIGSITDCTYVDKCHECVACTSNGIVLVYGCTLYAREYEEATLNNHKIYVKAIKVGHASINCITSVDQIIATGDDNGWINFFDKRMKLVFYMHNYELAPVTSISFSMERKEYKLVDASYDESDDDLDIETYFANYYENKEQEYEKIYKQNLPKDATMHRNPFIVRDFIVTTTDGVIYYMNFIQKTLTPLFQKSEDTVAAIECHEEMEYLIIAYDNGKIRLFNYVTHHLISEHTVPLAYDSETDDTAHITYIKYSCHGLHLACGMSTGEVWILDPILLTPKYEESLWYTKNCIVKICFSFDSKYMAYYSLNNTTCLFKYIPEIDHWQFSGKVRAHYKTINDIMFSFYTPSRLFTIGDDRFLVEYDLIESSAEALYIAFKERIEQTAIPKHFMYYPPEQGSKENYILIVDNEYKYKLINDVTAMCRSVTLGPAYSCYKGHPIKKIQSIKKRQYEYLFFSTNRHIGIQKIPLDCSPYKYAGMIGHPTMLKNIRVSYDGNYLFTCGVDDNSVLMWKINTRSLDILTRLGGTELEPYFCLIEGGMHGWLFEEMQDLFYYMQILHQGENTMLPRVVSDYIPITELPDLMRACGYYPSEFEVETMIVDIKYRDYDRTGQLREEISFLDFVLLYLNYRPAHGVEFSKLEENFYTFIYSVDEPQIGCIEKQDFIESLCTKGEPFTTSNLHKCLTTLMHTQEEDTDEEEARVSFFFLPDEIYLYSFVEDIMGIDMEKQMTE